MAWKKHGTGTLRVLQRPGPSSCSLFDGSPEPDYRGATKNFFLSPVLGFLGFLNFQDWGFLCYSLLFSPVRVHRSTGVFFVDFVLFI